MDFVWFGKLQEDVQKGTAVFYFLFYIIFRNIIARYHCCFSCLEAHTTADCPRFFKKLMDGKTKRHRAHDFVLEKVKQQQDKEPFVPWNYTHPRHCRPFHLNGWCGFGSGCIYKHECNIYCLLDAFF